MKILVTRPRADAEELVALLGARGHEVLLAPLLDIATTPGDPVEPGAAQAILFTSANGVRALLERNGGDLGALRALPVYAVGDATARAARDAGFAEVVSASGDVKALASLVVARVRPDIGPLLHVAGSQVAGDLAGALEAQGFTVARAPIYEAKPAEALPQDVVEALRRGEAQAALFYSPRTAAAFVALAGEVAPALGRTTAICLSPAVAEAVEDLPGAASWRDILTAAEPTQDSLLAALDRFVERETRPKGPAAANHAASEAAAESPLPPPLFGERHAPAAAPSSAPQRTSWRGRAALAVVTLLAIGGIAFYVARPDTVRSFFAFDWLASSLEEVTVETPPPAAPPRAAADRGQAENGQADDNQANVAQASEIADLRRQLADAEAKLRDAAPAPVSEAPASAPSTDQPPAELPPELATRLDGLEQRLGRLADRPTVAPDALRYTTDAFSARLTQLDDSLSALTQKLETQAAEQEAVRARAAEAQDIAYGALALRASLDRGLPFAAALPALRRAAGKMNLAGEIDKLTPAAATGFAAPQDLRGRLLDLAESVARVETAAPADNLLTRLWRSLTAAVVVRRVADDSAPVNAGDPADRLLSRAELRLADGDLDEAIAPVALLADRDSLSPGLRDGLGAWLADARARQAGETMAEALLQRGLLSGQESRP